MMKENNTSSKKKKMNKKKKTVIISLSILVVIAIIAVTVVGSYYKLRNQVYTEYTPQEKEGVDYKEVEGVTNVLLIGTDGRTLDEAARSDTIVIATLDSNNKVVKLTSIMRDTLVNIPGYGQQKINAAYAIGAAEDGAQGGAKLLMETIRDTFEIDLQKYIIVNFWGFETIIDEIGGIEADIQDYEIEELNKYIGDTTGSKAELITNTGVQTLNGAQALSYSRIRKVGNGSYERTERQRKVLSQVAGKLKDVSPLKYMSIANSLAKQVNTNIDIPEALNLGYTIYKFPELNIQQLQMPHTDLIVRDGVYKNLGWVLLIDKEQNSKVLHDFIFENKLPNPEEFDILSIQNLKAEMDAEEARYNSLHGINPEDYNDKNSDDVDMRLPQTTPQDSLNNQGSSTSGSHGNGTSGGNPTPNPGTAGGSGTTGENPGAGSGNPSGGAGNGTDGTVKPSEDGSGSDSGNQEKPPVAPSPGEDVNKPDSQHSQR